MILFAGDNSGVLFISSAPSTGVNFTVSETVPAPSQRVALGTKVIGGGAWAYYPPIYTIRTNGNQSAPAPKQQAFAKFIRPVQNVVIEPVKSYTSMGRQTVLIPSQGSTAKYRRSRKAQEDEEKFLLMMLGSL